MVNHIQHSHSRMIWSTFNIQHSTFVFNIHIQHLHSTFTFNIHIHIQHSHSTFTFNIHIQHSHSTFTFNIHIQHSHSTFTFNIHIQHSHSTFTFNIHIQHSHSTFTFNIHIQHSHSTFTFNIHIQHSHSTFTFNIHIQHSHSTFTFNIHIQHSHSTFTFNIHIQHSHSTFTFNIHIQHSHSTFTFNIHIQHSHSTFTFNIHIQHSHSTFTFNIHTFFVFSWGRGVAAADRILLQPVLSWTSSSAAPMALMSHFTQSIHLCVLLFFFSRAVPSPAFVFPRILVLVSLHAQTTSVFSLSCTCLWSSPCEKWEHQGANEDKEDHRQVHESLLACGPSTHLCHCQSLHVGASHRYCLHFIERCQLAGLSSWGSFTSRVVVSSYSTFTPLVCIDYRFVITALDGNEK